ncbi:hypothetical protein EES39_38800 [Streptomyces sp. ADI92-24]|uniref:hypothetical protein n=1 Tax=Streptomyces sp. ADI92-24 TaxID=1522756 RepID=UPI000F553606|nr:hypothetical protein [Streptomyces sp. ADI92-24]RPK32440.1 hypothetical protein EES39_38800 [Streptomyces sp. ADI92-24]
MRVRTTLATTAAFAALLSTGSVHAADDTGTAGGYSFNSSTRIDGTAKRQLTVGDFHIWKITLKPGQRLDVKASVEVPGGYDPGPSPHYERLGVRVYDPTRQPILCDGSDGTELIYRGHATAKSGGIFTATCTVGTLAYKAIEQAGTYYVQAGIGGATQTKGDTLPLTVSARTGPGVAPQPAESWDPGTPAGTVPDEEKPTAAPANPGRAQDTQHATAASSELSPWAFIGALAAGVAAALALSIVWRRTRSATDKQAIPDQAPSAISVPAGSPAPVALQPLVVPDGPPAVPPGEVPPVGKPPLPDWATSPEPPLPDWAASPSPDSSLRTN